MKLHTSVTSPFGRKVKVVAIELGLFDRLELLQEQLTPVQANERVNAANPLGKIPVLVTDEGQAIYDSVVIAEYLDDMAGGHRLFPAAGAERYAALTLQALGDGIMDAAIGVRYELSLRPEQYRWQPWIDGLMAKVTRALATAAAVERQPLPLDIGKITLGCALAFLEFRFPELTWRQDHPSLASFMDELAERPSFAKTKPA
ncbi:Glutathione S-transferase [Arboricoccus pini]|uniref:Glutathione S-transferase n=1 Tax=Arboricoccus pini TaxID=1963835 RepID=A0A212PYX5_9PROT|nr:glutathione S-transferase [Arboricoccus pini]SNB52164.1 Glutathione S-transferase [Arboricoccus pini]